MYIAETGQDDRTVPIDTVWRPFAEEYAGNLLKQADVAGIC